MLSWLDIERDPLADFHSLATNHYVNKFAYASGFTLLPQHLHEILLVATAFVIINVLARVLTPVFYSPYKFLSPKAKHGFDMHVVSQINAVTICLLSFPLFFSQSLNTLTSYTPYAGFIVAYNVGYFLWDLGVTTLFYKYEGFSYFAHAATALYTFSQALRPFMLNFAAPFIWFEASTPFVNVNWFSVHIPGLISPQVKLYNGLALIIVFFLCRIVSGPYHGYLMFTEAFNNPPSTVPSHAVNGVLFCYLTLVGLNFIWFFKMIKILVKTVKGLGKKKEE